MLGGILFEHRIKAEWQKDRYNVYYFWLKHTFYIVHKTNYLI